MAKEDGADEWAGANAFSVQVALAKQAHDDALAAKLAAAARKAERKRVYGILLECHFLSYLVAGLVLSGIVLLLSSFLVAAWAPLFALWMVTVLPLLMLWTFVNVVVGAPLFACATILNVALLPPILIVLAIVLTMVWMWWILDMSRRCDRALGSYLEWQGITVESLEKLALLEAQDKLLQQ